MLRIYSANKNGEDCYNILLDKPFHEDKLNQLLSILYKDNSYSPYKRSLYKQDEVVEYGFKLNFESPWSTHMRTILKNSNIDNILRIEKTKRVLTKNWEKEKANFDNILHSKYLSPIENFDSDVESLKTELIDINELEKVNATMGLAMDEKDIAYYKKLFVNDYKRNPTNVELFDLSQSNSEHSRHWFFNGILIDNKRVLPHSLFKMVKNTLNCCNTTNSVLAFCDNSSAIRGGEIITLYPSNVMKRNTRYREKANNEYLLNKVDYDLVFTAETHNFPTGIAPFPGAATGTGGRIRDNQSIGKGGLLIAGSAGYCVGNLFIDGYELPWETVEKERGRDIYHELPASPLKIEIEASNGASDYGNKIGEPIINGFTRSFGMNIKNRGRIEWLKPIMFTGGLGQMSHNHIKKANPERGMIICRLGGPAYRIGFGGGSASSRGQDNKNSKFDLCAVQRGDPEMENKLNKVIRACIELEAGNPIESIHDQGAGGLGNVCKEIIEPLGGEIYLEHVTLGDKSMTDIEIWTCEYQEVDVCLVKPENVEIIKNICIRENLIIDLIGVVTDTQRVVVYGKNGKDKIVDLQLSNVLGNIPRKEYILNEVKPKLYPILLPKDETLFQMCNKVFRLLSVGSKRFLTNKVDRSVTGLIAQQQCVGPAHTPLSNYGLVAQSHFTTKGIVTAIGEQPIKGLISTKSMADMTVIEMLLNIMWVKIDSLEDIKCSGNWMWDIKKEGEQHALYKTCSRMCDVVKEFGFSLDGGKDSLSMSTKVGKEVISSPRELVLSGYVGCEDINKRVTPDLKGLNTTLIFVDLAENKKRMGGSAFAQVLNQVGNDAPDMISSKTIKKCFYLVQHLLDSYIYSGHDRSDGGLVTTLIEMAIAGNVGFNINLPSEEKSYMNYLWNEEAGFVIEVHTKSVKYVTNCFNINCIPIHVLGTTNQSGTITINHGKEVILNTTVHIMREIWEATSFEIEKLQCNTVCVKEEFDAMKDFAYKNERYYDCKLNVNTTSLIQNMDPLNLPPESKNNPLVAIIREEGSNGDREMATAFKVSRFRPVDVTMSDLLKDDFTLDSFRGVVFVGGFSYADTLGAGNGWATVIENTNIKEKFNKFVSRSDTFTLGICNGCQLMVKLGIFGKNVDIKQNISKRFESRFSYVEVCDSNGIFFNSMTSSKLGVWVAHGEGRFVLKKGYEEDCNIPLKYINLNGDVTMKYPYNPNGSHESAAAISTKDGRHLAMMPHPERTIFAWQAPWLPEHWKKYKYYAWIQMFISMNIWSRK